MWVKTGLLLARAPLSEVTTLDTPTTTRGGQGRAARPGRRPDRPDDQVGVGQLGLMDVNLDGGGAFPRKRLLPNRWPW